MRAILLPYSTSHLTVFMEIPMQLWSACQEFLYIFAALYNWTDCLLKILQYFERGCAIVQYFVNYTIKGR